MSKHHPRGQKAPANSVHPQQGNEAKASSLPRVDSVFGNLLNAENVFHHYVSRDLARIAARLEVPDADIADVVQDTWFEAIKHRDELKGADLERRLVCWLRTVVRNKALDLLWHRGLHVSVALDAQEVDLVDDAERDRAEAAEQGECLAALLEQGRAGHEDNHRLLCEHYLQQRSVKELAAALGMTENAIDHRIRRQVAYLRSLTE